ncbi:MAG: glycosylase [Herbaspirillum sp.]|jgi:outer membrane PBP1 activator LpoA protein|nr:glycosylase [Herbaspirillum sp.]
MSGKLIRMLLLSGVVTGLCASVQANTTNTPDDPSLISVAAAASFTPPAAAPVKIALLLPVRSGIFGAAADAVRTGFLTAYEHDKQGVIVNLVESGDTPAEMLRTYLAALGGNDVIVGPLSRNGAAAIAQSGKVDKPTVALTQPEGEIESALPPKMLVAALAVEEEARQAAAWTDRERIGGKIFAVSTSIAWQRRTVKAFMAQGKVLGLDVTPLELSAANGALSASGLVQLKQRMDTDHPALLFVALGAQQATQLRSAIGTDTPLYGISQLNPRNQSDDPSMREPVLDGVKLLDIPWQVETDSPVVATYPRPIIEDPKQHNADLDRLYALGIDAYRIALEIGRGKKSFDIDGVTGKLNISIDSFGSHFQRLETRAVYQNGIVVPTQAQR